MFFGGVIGFDREQTSKPAGLRTHILVAAAALLVGVSGVILEQVAPQEAMVRSDPVRIIEAIIALSAQVRFCAAIVPIRSKD